MVVDHGHHPGVFVDLYGPCIERECVMPAGSEAYGQRAQLPHNLTHRNRGVDNDCEIQGTHSEPT
jgi:hypothetical protein